eukprot:232319-Alexandrium_andersonii.AAC.1
MPKRSPQARRGRVCFVLLSLRALAAACSPGVQAWAGRRLRNPPSAPSATAAQSSDESEEDQSEEIITPSCR